MSTSRKYLKPTLRIALLCASALMLSTAFAEDGSNLSDVQYHRGHESGRTISTGMDTSGFPTDENGYISEVRELQYQPGSESGRTSSTGMETSGFPADENGYITELRELQYHPGSDGSHVS